MDFIPKNQQEEKTMLAEIGVKSISSLFSDIPDTVRSVLRLDKGMSESEVRSKVSHLASLNKMYKSTFLGGGSYNHYIPSVVNHVVSRSEFYTAYTPYQAEMSQGILQAIFEYQSMICSIFGMDVSNASVYDGAEAVAEAASICLNKTKRNKILVIGDVHPEYKQVLKTYMDARGALVVEADKIEMNQEIAGVIIQSPNFFGTIEDVEKIASQVHSQGGLLVVAVSDPTCYGLLKPPGILGADIVAAEGQSFGNPRCFGGPYLGVLCVKNELMRYLPGRIVGEAVDNKGRKGYTLTLQAREQHIRREKASSNICSNESLNALAASVYLSALGCNGLRQVAELNISKSHYMADKIKELGLKIVTDNFYNEFVVEFGSELVVEELEKKLEEKNIQSGLCLKRFFSSKANSVLFCVTECCTKKDIDELVEVINEVNI